MVVCPGHPQFQLRKSLVPRDSSVVGRPRWFAILISVPALNPWIRMCTACVPQWLRSTRCVGSVCSFKFPSLNDSFIKGFLEKWNLGTSLRLLHWQWLNWPSHTRCSRRLKFWFLSPEIHISWLPHSSAETLNYSVTMIWTHNAKKTEKQPVGFFHLIVARRM